MWGYGYGWPGMLAMSLSILFWFALLAVVVWAVYRWVGNRTLAGGPSAGPSALDILRQRYARGEIDTATYEEMRQRLTADHGSDGPAAGAGA